MKKLILGCGYLGSRVAARWKSQGDEVVAVTRSPDRADEFRHQGWSPIVADVLRPETLPAIGEVDTVLFALGYDRRAGESVEKVFVEGLRHALAWVPASVRCFVYISSTGVYGQRSGEWVDEGSPCEPARAGGRACWQAEQLLASHPLGKRSIVLRLAGIYGPGRVPRQADLLAGVPLDTPPNGYLNLIHVEDAADIVCRAAAELTPPDCFTVSDGHPVLRRDYVSEIAARIGAPPPRFCEPNEGRAAFSRAESDKRVSNGKIVAALRLSLRFPSYREGLAAVLRPPTDSTADVGQRTGGG